MSLAAVGIGSNLGDRLANLVAATVGLGAEARLAGVSSIYETAPVGGPEQGPFLNAVAIVETARPAAALLESMLSIERARDRKRLVRWGPRSLDLDLLLFDAAMIDLPGLTVPHPRLLERRFVVEPLLEVWPEAVLPDGTSVGSIGVEGDEPIAVYPFPSVSSPLGGGGLVFAPPSGGSTARRAGRGVKP
ncbi:MAG: 2-amino-4-hydroxy-6-hydroxymethyldihydropteridine diphosphokinase [Acidimicrobiia bacterium]|nr:MAG: 2-amino-4-hydroxy-6-hydroxymethyldihydropteridine diphosphokinase [Acidimicrobiia bacterium]